MTRSLDDYKPDNRFIGLFVGDSGSGKSGAAASFPHPYHELDPDGRFAGIVGMVNAGIIKDRQITYTSFDRLGGWEQISKELERINVLKVAFKTSPMQYQFPYKTIGLGSLGSLARIIGNLARKELGGKVIGGLRLNAPGDARAESNGVHQVLDYLVSYPCNVICTAHTIEKWGKPPIVDKEDQYKPNVVIGEKINLTDNLSASIVSVFSDVYKFNREVINNKLKYTVNFASELAKNSFGIPPGEHDITGKNFYEFLQELIKKYQSKVEKVS